MTVRWSTEAADEASQRLGGVDAMMRTRCNVDGAVPMSSQKMDDEVVGLTGKAVSAQWVDSVPA